MSPRLPLHFIYIGVLGCCTFVVNNIPMGILSDVRNAFLTLNDRAFDPLFTDNAVRHQILKRCPLFCDGHNVLGA